MWAECGKTARDTAENNVSNSCHYPRQEGQREGTTWGAQIITHERRDVGKRTVLKNQRHRSWWCGLPDSSCDFWLRDQPACGINTMTSLSFCSSDHLPNYLGSDISHVVRKDLKFNDSFSFMLASLSSTHRK